MSSLSTKVPSGSPNWFGISMVLIGFIAGFGVANVMDGGGLTFPTDSKKGYVEQKAEPTPSDPAPARAEAPSAGEVAPVSVKDDHIKGNPKARISVIEYSDFECPFCERHHPTMQAVVDEYGDDVNWVYRHFPLGFHPNAQKAAEASECAVELGGKDAFWDYADIIFEKGPDSSQLVSYAEELGLDGTKFGDCLDSGKYENKVKDQMAAGQAAGVNGTPGNIVYDNKTKEAKLVSGAQPLSNFKSIIDAMLQ